MYIGILSKDILKYANEVYIRRVYMRFGWVFVCFCTPNSYPVEKHPVCTLSYPAVSTGAVVMIVSTLDIL